MITVGGSLNKTYYGCDWEQRGVAIYDLSAALWGVSSSPLPSPLLPYHSSNADLATGPIFIVDAPPYNVTSLIVKTIGGTVNGGATLRAPVNGYNNTALAAVMSATRSTSTSPPTTAPSPTSPAHPKSRTGTIVGAVIGSVAGAGLVLAGLAWQLHKRRKDAALSPSTPLVEAPQTNAKFEVAGDMKPPLEAPGTELPWELAAKREPAELAPTMVAELEAGHGASEAEPGSATSAAELSGTAVPAGQRLGIPHITVPEGEEAEGGEGVVGRSGG
jgi:hypothetical protein